MSAGAFNNGGDDLIADLKAALATSEQARKQAEELHAEAFRAGISQQDRARQAEEERDRFRRLLESVDTTLLQLRTCSEDPDVRKWIQAYRETLKLALTPTPEAQDA